MAIQSVSKTPLNHYINNLKVQKPDNAMAQAGQSAAANAPTSSTDRVELSSQAKALSAQRNTGNVRNAVQVQAPDAGRAAYVQAIKQKVQTGTYTVDNAKLANAVIKDVLNNMG